MNIHLEKETFNNILHMSNLTLTHQIIIINDLLDFVFAEYSEDEIISIIKEGDTYVR